MGSIQNGNKSSQPSALGVPGFALVTGAASGIGRAIVRLLAREGCAGIVLADVNSKAAEGVKTELLDIATHTDFKCVTAVVDVSNEASVAAMMKTTVEAFGRIDYAVNCAGIGAVKGPVADGELSNWNKMIQINLTGVFLCLKEEVKQMQTQEPLVSDRWVSLQKLLSFPTDSTARAYAPLQRGAIVNIASLAATNGLRHSGAYTAAKHGVAGLTRTAALDHPDIKCNAIVPGYIETPLTSAPGEMRNNALDKVNNWTPMMRFGRPEEIAEGVVWLLGYRSNFVHGSLLAMDGGYLTH
jgi:NAD(P)-dependent dehydrogenase (short-subunit alcohol dehydrogenase family)